MKHLINLFFLTFITSLQAQHIGGIRTVTYEQFPNGEIRIEDSVRPISKFSYTYNADIPKLSMEQVRELRDSSKTIVSDSLIKGTYSDFILHFTPKHKIVLAILKEGNVRISSIEQDGKTIISWWYIGILISVVLFFSNIFFSRGTIVYDLLKVTNAIILFLVTYSTIISLPLTQVLLPLGNHYGFISIIPVAILFLNSKTNIWYTIYSILIILFCVLTYLQL